MAVDSPSKTPNISTSPTNTNSKNSSSININKVNNSNNKPIYFGAYKAFQSIYFDAYRALTGEKNIKGGTEATTLKYSDPAADQQSCIAKIKYHSSIDFKFNKIENPEQAKQMLDQNKDNLDSSTLQNLVKTLITNCISIDKVYDTILNIPIAESLLEQYKEIFTADTFKGLVTNFIKQCSTPVNNRFLGRYGEVNNLDIAMTLIEKYETLFDKTVIQSFKTTLAKNCAKGLEGFMLDFAYEGTLQESSLFEKSKLMQQYKLKFEDNTYQELLTYYITMYNKCIIHGYDEYNALYFQDRSIQLLEQFKSDLNPDNYKSLVTHLITAYSSTKVSKNFQSENYSWVYNPLLAKKLIDDNTGILGADTVKNLNKTLIDSCVSEIEEFIENHHFERAYSRLNDEASAQSLTKKLKSYTSILGPVATRDLVQYFIQKYCASLSDWRSHRQDISVIALLDRYKAWYLSMDYNFYQQHIKTLFERSNSADMVDYLLNCPENKNIITSEMISNKYKTTYYDEIKSLIKQYQQKNLIFSQANLSSPKIF